MGNVTLKFNPSYQAEMKIRVTLAYVEKSERLIAEAAAMTPERPGTEKYQKTLRESWSQLRTMQEKLQGLI